MQENNPEIRRRELLNEARRHYSSQGMQFPAIHPRYGRLYRELYPDPDRTIAAQALHKTQKEEQKGSFTSRLMAAALLFLLFLYVSQNQISVRGIESEKIIETIQGDLDFHGKSIRSELEKLR